MSDNGFVEFTTRGGVTLKLRPVSPFLLDRAANSFKPPNAPEYTERIQLPGMPEATQTHTMRDGTEATTPEEKQAWANYQAEIAKIEKSKNIRMIEMVILPSVYTDLELPTDDSWERMQRYIGVEVPTEEMARKSHYILTQILITESDIHGALNKVLQISQLPQEIISSAEQSFPDPLQQQ
jgi:hypothetical protein